MRLSLLLLGMMLLARMAMTALVKMQKKRTALVITMAMLVEMTMSMMVISCYVDEGDEDGG